MTAPTKEQAQAELAAAEAAVAAFDGGRLVREDGSPDAEAAGELARLRARVEAAKAQLATVG
jgi:hypothetical protein